MSVPVKNTAYEFYITLIDSVTGLFKVDPTIEAGDFQISIDGADYVDLTNLPAANPAGTIAVKISLTADEMNASKVNIVGADVADAEWDDVFVPIEIPVGSLDLIEKLLRNDLIIDRDTGIMTLLDDDQVTVLFSWDLFEDTAETLRYRKQGVEVRKRIV